jgi:hypothetical protein
MIWVRDAQRSRGVWYARVHFHQRCDGSGLDDWKRAWGPKDSMDVSQVHVLADQKEKIACLSRIVYAVK